MQSGHAGPVLRQIRASAGSGKTYTLTASFLDLLAGASEDAASTGCRSARPTSHCWPEILAVTFTNRAAAEMQERIIGRLKETALGGKRSRDKTGGWTPEAASRWLDVILRRYGSLNIRTIDSLLHLIVRLGALQLELPPDFTPVFAAGEALAPLLDAHLEQSRHNTAARALLEDACRNLVLHDGTYRGFLAGSVLRKRVTDLVLPLLHLGSHPLSEPDDVAVRLEELAAGLRDRAGLLSACLRDDGLKPSAHFLKALEKCREIRSGEAAPKSVTLRKSCLDECLLKASKGAATARAEALFSGLRQAVEDLDRQGGGLRQALQIMPFVPLARALVRELPGFLRREGAVPAVLVPRLAQRVLSGEHGVSETFCRLGTSLTHLLIDEFQDTSRAQWLAVRPLVLEALSKGGSLIWVGDVKQAIYGWRGGDAALFDEVLSDPELTAVAPFPRLDTLPTNWRSRSVVVGFNNAVFSRLAEAETASAVLAALLPAGTPQEVTEKARILVQRGFAGSGQLECGKKGGYVRLERVKGEDDNPDEAVRNRLLELMSELSDRRPWGDLTVLVRSNRRCTQVAEWLMSRGIPVVTDNSFLLAEHPLVIQLIALLSFADAADDDLAFWTLISGPLLPLSVEDRADLAAWPADRLTSMPLFAAFREDFPEAWENWLAPFYSGGGLLTAYDTVHEALDRVDAMSRFPEEAVFLRRFLEVLHSAETQGYGSVSSFLGYWKQHGGEEKAPMPESLDAVRVMTMHKAKGLQFPVVIIPWHDLNVRADAAPAAMDINGLHLLTRPGPGLGAPYYTALADAAREALHLLYVAWTRPEEELYGLLAHSSRHSGCMDALETLLADLPLQQGRYERGQPHVKSPKPAAYSPEFTEQPAQTPPADKVRAPAAAISRREDGVREALSLPNHRRPMPRLPRLRIFRNPLEAFPLTPQRREAFMRHCLTQLHLSADAQTDARRAVEEGLRTFPVPLENVLEDLENIAAALTWYASLPEAQDWLRRGVPDQALVDASGEICRADLVVEGEEDVTVVEYKTGSPRKEHGIRLRQYMELLAEAQPKPVQGALVYLDAGTVCRHALS